MWPLPRSEVVGVTDVIAALHEMELFHRADHGNVIRLSRLTKAECHQCLHGC